MNYKEVECFLSGNRRLWLITGVAGFIGSNLLERLLNLGQNVIGIDNFETGFQKNLDMVRKSVGELCWENNFFFLEADICDKDIQSTVGEALLDKWGVDSVDYILHQAALGSVPRSFDNPIRTNEVNLGGFLQVLQLANSFSCSRFVYAASSSTYGDHPSLPKVEDVIGLPLSPYAVTKYANELYANVLSQSYGLGCVGLRYFNVFGKRQNPNGAYAAVIPKWIDKLLSGEEVFVNGDGHTSRDFTYIENVIQANLLSATNEIKAGAFHEVFNVAIGESTSLNILIDILIRGLEQKGEQIQANIRYRDFRQGDVFKSLACIDKAKEVIEYDPVVSVEKGIGFALDWYVEEFSASKGVN